jgi:hypothetical protein
MGGVSAAYSDELSINFANPASYSRFQSIIEEKSKKAASGRVLLDVGINYDNRTLRNPDLPEKFNSPNLYFSYVQVGVPLNKNWGLSFGLRPLSRISYKINRIGIMSDPISGKPIDSALTRFTGSGGSYLPSIGTGFALKNFSIGANMGFLFGRKEYNTKISFINSDSSLYSNSNHTTRSSFGDVYFNAGAQYKINFTKKTHLNLGFSGNWEQSLKASKDLIRETFVKNQNGGDTRVDSVYEQLSAKGTIVYPASYTAGFVVEHTEEKGNGWMLGADLVNTKWSNYRYFNEKDSVQDNWQVRVGGSYRPLSKPNYFSNVIYRAGFFFGPDYIHPGNELPQLGVSFGLGLPIANYNRLSPGQFTIFNVGLEYIRRGNNSNALKENLFRFSIGLNFSDLWFSKRKYD